MSVVLLNALKTCSKEYCEGKQDDPRKVTWNQKPKGGNNPKTNTDTHLCKTEIRGGWSGARVWVWSCYLGASTCPCERCEWSH